VCAALGTGLPIEALEVAFQETPMNLRMLELARHLRARHCVGIITDNKADRIDFLRKQHGLAEWFDPIVVSAEVGSGEDHTAIFERALTLVGASPAECIFIDNTEDNLVVPSALGMWTLHFDERNEIDTLRSSIEAICASA